MFTNIGDGTWRYCEAPVNSKLRVSLHAKEAQEFREDANIQPNGSACGRLRRMDDDKLSKLAIAASDNRSPSLFIFLMSGEVHQLDRAASELSHIYGRHQKVEVPDSIVSGSIRNRRKVSASWQKRRLRGKKQLFHQRGSRVFSSCVHLSRIQLYTRADYNAHTNIKVILSSLLKNARSHVISSIRRPRLQLLVKVGKKLAVLLFTFHAFLGG